MLSIARRDIVDIELLNLEILILSNNLIRHIDNIMSFCNLRQLDISQNYGIDITPLQHMKGLKVLNTSWNRLQSIQALSSLKSLQELDLSGNKRLICALTTPSLVKLQIPYAFLTSVSSIQSLYNLIELDLSENALVDVFHLHFITNLQLLNLSCNQLCSVIPLRRLVLCVS
ncbi:DUF2252_family protein [Hexamita inflata]|uniref:DUF2252_family protein n=1 Tax=Hexamita inflata TaxID=28002 RepID=A0ABP1HZT5_9EUKA